MSSYPADNPNRTDPAEPYGSTPAVPLNPAAGDDPREIRAEIAHTRAEMGETINAIQDRLDPERLKEQVREEVRDRVDHVKDQVRDATIGRAEHVMNMVDYQAREAGSSLWDRIRANPIPSAMVGFGLAWMFMNGGGHSHHERWDRRGYGRASYYPESGYRSGYAGYEYPEGQGYYSGYYSSRGYRQPSGPNVAEQARQTASNVADRVGDQVGQVTDQVQNQVQQVGQQAQQMGQQVGQQFQQLGDQAQDRFQDYAGSVQGQFDQARWTVERAVRENPLAAGVFALAFGAFIGMLVPETPQEQQMFGPAREQVMEKAQGVAQDAMQNVQQTVQQAGDQVQNAVQSAGSSQSGTSGSSTTSSGQSASTTSNTGPSNQGRTRTA
jgi:ElaB/YqjD/DUF883 family membrane-anchored ribosome-binding protein